LKKREVTPSGHGTAETAGPMSTEDIQRARKRFVAWIDWYVDWHEEEIPNQAVLARRLGLSRSGANQLFAKDSTRLPSFETLLAARALLGGMGIDAMLFTDPPSARPPRRQK
jgi:hypothetical protein